MHQLIGLDYIPIIPIILESVRKPVIFEFFFHPKWLALHFCVPFQRRRFLLFRDSRWRMVEGGNEKISPTRCVEDEDGFCPRLSSTRIPRGFLMKIRLVCTQLRTDF